MHHTDAPISEPRGPAFLRPGRSTFALSLWQVTTNRGDLPPVRLAVERFADNPAGLRTAEALRLYDDGGLLTFEDLSAAIGSDKTALGFLRLAWAEAATWVDKRVHVWAATACGPEWPRLLDTTAERARATQSETVARIVGSMLAGDTPLSFPALIADAAGGGVRLGTATRAIATDGVVLDRAIEALGYLATLANSAAAGDPKPAKRPAVPTRKPLRAERLGVPFAQPHPNPAIHRWAGHADGERQGGQAAPTGQAEQNSRPDPNVA